MPAIRIEGLQQFQAQLHQLAEQAPEQLDAVNLDIAQLVAVEARHGAPHGRHEGGGLVVPIMASIKAMQLSGQAVITVGGRLTPHAAVKEFGGRIPRRGFKTIGRGRARAAAAIARAAAHGAVTHVRKQAYLYPAITAKSEVITARYQAMLDRWIGRLANG